MESGPLPSELVPAPATRRGTLYATFPGALALIPKQDALASLGVTVFSCDYNGWTDVPEEEREGIEAFEASVRPPVPAQVPTVIRVPADPLRTLHTRKAA